jgi:hypothetical protein
MKLLRESEAMTVRKAVCVAGAECVVITLIPQRLCAIDPWQWHGDQSSAQNEMHVRIEMTADDSHHRCIVSAIKRFSHSGGIILVFRHDKLSRHSACNQ